MNHIPGVGFHPTDRELVIFYLWRKVQSLQGAILPSGAEVIPELDLYMQEPWHLRENPSLVITSNREWYFFTSLGKKSANSIRINRATQAGYWRATGRDKEIKEEERIVGMRKTLIFYKGRAPVGERTNFVAHEYRLHEDLDASQEFVLCKVMDKSEIGSWRADNEVLQIDEDDELKPGPVMQFLETGITSTSMLVPTPMETLTIAGINNIRISAPSFSVDEEAWDDFQLLGDLVPLTDFPTLRDEEDFSSPCSK